MQPLRFGLCKTRWLAQGRRGERAVVAASLARSQAHTHTAAPVHAGSVREGAQERPDDGAYPARWCDPLDEVAPPRRWQVVLCFIQRRESFRQLRPHGGCPSCRTRGGTGCYHCDFPWHAFCVTPDCARCPACGVACGGGAAVAPQVEGKAAATQRRACTGGGKLLPHPGEEPPRRNAPAAASAGRVVTAPSDG